VSISIRMTRERTGGQGGRKLDAAVASPSPPLHVGLDLLFWHPQAGGMARYARELTRAMRTLEPDLRVTAYVSRELPADAPQALGDGVHIVRYPVNMTHDKRSVANLWAHWGRVAAHAARSGVHVVHGPANVAPLWAGGVARVVTLHDLIWLRDAAASLGWPATLAMRLTALPSAWRADRVLTGSHASKDDICATLPIDPSRVDVAWHGIAQHAPAAPEDEEVLRRRLQLGDAPVVLCVAQKRAHKNLDGLVRALALLADRSAILVLPGEPTAHEAQLLALAAELGVADRLRILGWLRDEEIEGLYALATVFALPSREEGFGLPILEAMRRGTPVACSNRSSLPEVAGDAAELFDPDDPAAIAAALDSLLASPARRAELRARGLERCAQFTWERSARLTLACYRRAIAQRGGRRT
jgi:glycosyltransferase involved in cell wall biosynthesis